MEICPRCKNNEINAEDNYCKICGLDLKEKATAATAATHEIVINTYDEQFKKSLPMLNRELNRRIESLSVEW